MVIEDKDFPYLAKTTEDYVNVSQWCYEHFGEFGVRWYRLGTDPLSDSEDHYYFTNEQDYNWFILKWY